MAEFLTAPSKALKTMIEAFHLVGEADAINYGAYYPYNHAYSWMSKVRVPGVDLPDDQMNQVVETERMILDDYDQILNRGWPEFYSDFMEKRVFNDVPPERLPSTQAPLSVRAEWALHGIPVLSGGTVSLPFERLCGARSLNFFFLDLITIPEKSLRSWRRPHGMISSVFHPTMVELVDILTTVCV